MVTGNCVASRPGMTHSNILIFTLDTVERNVIAYVHLSLSRMFNKSFELRVCLFLYFYYVVSFYGRPYHLNCDRVSVHSVPMASSILFPSLYLFVVGFYIKFKIKNNDFRAFPPNFVICQFRKWIYLMPEINTIFFVVLPKSDIYRCTVHSANTDLVLCTQLTSFDRCYRFSKSPKRFIDFTVRVRVRVFLSFLPLWQWLCLWVACSLI